MRLVLLGAPGVGKGTQADAICAARGVPHVSTGDMFRAAMTDGSELGARVKGFVESGKLVPDDVTAELVSRRLQAADCSKGFLLDGFPRTVGQAERLEKILAGLKAGLDAVIYMTASEETVVERLSGRRMCSNKACGANYHVKFKAPKKEGVCDLCGSALYQRADDTEATIRGRLKVFREQTEPLVAWYRRRRIHGKRARGDRSGVERRRRSMRRVL